MKTKTGLFVLAILTSIGMSTRVFAGETSVAAYATYWDAHLANDVGGGEEDGVGGGIKIRKSFLAFLSADIRASYIDFSNLDTTVVPLEATLMVQIPFIIEPYAGIGASYYIFDSNLPGLEDGAGVYGVLGAQLNLWVVGAFAEIRYNETDTKLMDGTSINLGLMVKW